MLSRWGKHPSRSFHGATHGSLGCPKSRVNVERFLPSRLCEPSARSAQCQGLALCGPQCSHVHRADSCTGGLAVTAFRHPSVGAATFATPRFDSRVNSRGSALYEAYLLRGYRPEQAPFLRRCEVCFAAAIHTWSLLASRFVFFVFCWRTFLAQCCWVLDAKLRDRLLGTGAKTPIGSCLACVQGSQSARPPPLLDRKFCFVARGVLLIVSRRRFAALVDCSSHCSRDFVQ